MTKAVRDDVVGESLIVVAKAETSFVPGLRSAGAKRGDRHQ